jgi:asparagine synthase (glutamine-hydrolysing)
MTNVESSISFEDLLPEADRDAITSILERLEAMAMDCVARTVSKDFVLAYSAGIDSSILAELLRRNLGGATLLTLGRVESSDLKAASRDLLSTRSGFNLVLENIGTQDIEDAAVRVSKIVRVSNLSHFEDCISFWLTALAASKMKDVKYILSANGPDELFCGYDRFRRIVDEQGYPAVEKEITKALDSADKLRKQVALVVSEFGYETQEPFLEQEFREFSLKIPAEYKILKGNDVLRKRVWRCLGRALGIPDITVVRQKKAMQYGMGIHPVVLSLVKKDRIDIMLETN